MVTSMGNYDDDKIELNLSYSDFNRLYNDAKLNFKLGKLTKSQYNDTLDELDCHYIGDEGL